MVFIVIRVYLVFMWNVFIGFVFYMILVVFFDEKFLKKIIKWWGFFNVCVDDN